MLHILEIVRFLETLLNYLTPIAESNLHRTCRAIHYCFQRYREWNIGGIPCISSDLTAVCPKAFTYSNQYLAPKFKIEPPRFSKRVIHESHSHQRIYLDYCLNYYGPQLQWGLKAVAIIPSKKILLPYTGEMINTAEKNRRQKVYDRKSVS